MSWRIPGVPSDGYVTGDRITAVDNEIELVASLGIAFFCICCAKLI